MNTCDSCKFWEEERLPKDHPALGCGVCLRVGDFQHPMRHEVDVERDAFFATNEAYFTGGSLVTYPKFGCVHWEAKDAG